MFLKINLKRNLEILLKNLYFYDIQFLFPYI